MAFGEKPPWFPSGAEYFSITPHPAVAGAGRRDGCPGEEHSTHEPPFRGNTDAQRREQERRQRAAERATARHQRKQRAAYRQHREADARRRTEEIEQRVAEPGQLLPAGNRTSSTFTPEARKSTVEIEPFSPGRHMLSADEDRAVKRPATQCRRLHRNVVATGMETRQSVDPAAVSRTAAVAAATASR